MTSAVGVTSAPSVSFRRFLPHEKPITTSARYRDYHADDAADEEDTGFIIDRIPPQMLSDQDVGVLLEARLAAEEEAWERDHLHLSWDAEWHGDWQQPKGAVDREYLPLAFALAARP